MDEMIANSRSSLQSEKGDSQPVLLRRKKALLGYRMRNMGVNKDLTSYVKDEGRKEALQDRGSLGLAEGLTQGQLDNFMQELGLEASKFTKLRAAPLPQHDQAKGQLKKSKDDSDVGVPPLKRSSTAPAGKRPSLPRMGSSSQAMDLTAFVQSKQRKETLEQRKAEEERRREAGEGDVDWSAFLAKIGVGNKCVKKRLKDSTGESTVTDILDMLLEEECTVDDDQLHALLLFEKKRRDTRELIDVRATPHRQPSPLVSCKAKTETVTRRGSSPGASADLSGQALERAISQGNVSASDVESILANEQAKRMQRRTIDVRPS